MYVDTYNLAGVWYYSMEVANCMALEFNICWLAS